MTNEVTTIPTGSLLKKILGIMSELTYIQKGDKKVNGQYSFVSHDQVSEKVQPLLVKYGVCALPSVEECIQNNNRTEIKLQTTFIDADSPDQHFTIRTIGHGIDPGDKGPGKAISYALKYAYLKVFCLPSGDDPDKDANARYEPAKCLEFDSILPDKMTKEKKEKLKKFLEYAAKATNKHVEEVKREAVTRPEAFLKSFENWSK